MGERPIVREQERARRVLVQPSNRDDARLRRDELDDGRAPVRVARGRDDARRLVQEDVRERLPLDALAVDLDDVARTDQRC